MARHRLSPDELQQGQRELHMKDVESGRKGKPRGDRPGADQRARGDMDKQGHTAKGRAGMTKPNHSKGCTCSECRSRGYGV